MRALVEKSIIENFEKKRLDELNVDFLNFDRAKDGKSKLVSNINKNGLDWRDNPDFDIRVFVSSLTDEELLFVLDQQHCQDYR